MPEVVVVTKYGDARLSRTEHDVTRSLKQLLDAAGRVPPDLTFEEFRQMLLLLGWSPVRSFGPGYCRSVWVRGGQLLTIEPTADGGCHARQVRLALDLGF